MTVQSKDVRYATLAVAIVALVAAPAAARASDVEPVVVHVRMVPGETRHYETRIVYAMTVDKQSQFDEELIARVRLRTEDLADDDSILVHQSYDDVSVGKNDLKLDPSQVRATEVTYRLHSDGSMTDRAINGEPVSDGQSDDYLAWVPHFPPEGLHLGEQQDVPLRLPLPLPNLQARVPVQTTAIAVEAQDDRSVLRFGQALSVGEHEIPLGPFGSLGTAVLSAAGENTISMDADSGWIVRQNGFVNFALKDAGQDGEQHTAVGSYQSSQTLTGEELAETN